MKFNLKNRPKMRTGNMDRTLFLGKEVEEWFEGFEKELREMQEFRAPLIYKNKKWVKIKEILGEQEK